MTKIITKLYIFLILLLLFFSLIFGGTMAHPGPPLPPSLMAAHGMVYGLYVLSFEGRQWKDR
jgi:hypothetical protein